MWVYEEVLDLGMCWCISIKKNNVNHALIGFYWVLEMASPVELIP